MDDEERALLDCFRDGTCDEFSHEHHVHVAWLLLQSHPLTEAIEQFARGARTLASARGRPEFYHETVTWAYMILVHERIHREAAADWQQFRAANADLFAPDKGVLKSYYQPATLESDLARRVFLLPDRREPVLTTPHEPTPEMIAYFERRTAEHIERVRRCLAVMAEVTQYGEQLIERGRVHDASKFEHPERVPYIWLTERHRCRRQGKPFRYPPGMDDLVREALTHHLTSNRHHPDFHDDPNDMTEVDLIEMVCDWTAMAQEHGENGGSARSWADKTIGHHLALNDEKRCFVYAMIELLDTHFPEG